MMEYSLPSSVLNLKRTYELRIIEARNELQTLKFEMDNSYWVGLTKISRMLVCSRPFGHMSMSYLVAYII
jgi:hypothetical protein